ncbi:hypothetical protein SAMN04488134_11618 [Amphibacillus marinus]|uniref:Cellobiose phosphorylase n=2 Tax=Amphibacillus marinus TaxID=872970 RepID=A0A1H8TGG8_9BACI|nr:hypothetical protein SAMN04488134_11618 [Amphibacillus marinus]
MYTLLDDQRFQIKNYQTSSPFASFLPGIAGEDGIPMWVFYVNRGQAIASFGVEDKNNMMTEFYPADKAHQMTPLEGFRTFIKGDRNGQLFSYEPFRESDPAIEDQMIIDQNTLTLTHVNKIKQLRIEVLYYTLPGQELPGLVREILIKNIGDDQVKLELLDGAATLFPANVAIGGYKEIGNTLKSWFDVEQLDEQINYYFMRGSTADQAEVSQSEQGNFFASMLYTKQGNNRIAPVFDRQCVFGKDLTLNEAQFFQENSIDIIQAFSQVSTNKVACAFTPVSYCLNRDEEIKLVSIIGQADSRVKACQLLDEVFAGQKINQLRQAAQQLAKTLTDRVATKTALAKFDAYVKQNYLDNGLRGGFPKVFTNDQVSKVFYMYSRKHGDLERDYNFFSISPTFYSQGNGNYRDMNQNRRLDVRFEPRIEDTNIKQFVNLIQLDGYNPLALKSVRYTLPSNQITLIKQVIPAELSAEFTQLVTTGYTPGEVKAFINAHKLVDINIEQLLTALLLVSDEALEAVHGEGFWIDHWTYNLDLLDSYLAIYPDRVTKLFFTEGYRFFNSPAYVNPKSVKYTKRGERLRQYHAVEEAETEQHHQWVCVKGAPDQLVTTNLFSKLVLLAANKTATLAPYGLGIEMEAGKPGWNDALNGLPGMFGAGVSELYELKRLLDLLLTINSEQQAELSLPIEAGCFVQELATKLAYLADEGLSLNLWNTTTSIREHYRAQLKLGVNGELFTCSIQEAHAFLTYFKEAVDRAVGAVEDFSQGLVPTYFYFDVAVNERGQVVEVDPHEVTPFLEGVVKKMKLTTSVAEARALHQQVTDSALYDHKLGMYKTSGSIHNEPIELGRAKFFTPGWLENESIFLHMSYKYILELLKAGLYDEFYQALQTGLVPFMDPSVYGRSTLENVSFVVSSANPDPTIHGKGYVARLSGSTVEFLQIWLEMFAGPELFSYRNQLTFQLDPKLPDWLFDDKGLTSFTLFSHIKVVYENRKRKQCYGPEGVKPVRYRCTLYDGEERVIEADKITGDLAFAIRSGQIQAIYVTLD